MKNTLRARQFLFSRQLLQYLSSMLPPFTYYIPSFLHFIPSLHSFMDLPEISSLVSEFLTVSELARCIRVCRQWQFMFRPILYGGKIEFYSSGSPYQPSFEIASRHGHLMQSLQCSGEITQDYLSIPSITHLTELALSRGNDSMVFKATYWDAIVALVRRNPRLTRLRLMSGLWPPVPPYDDDLDPTVPSKVRTTPKRDHLWDAVAEHPNLKHLFIMNTRWATVQPYTTSFWHAISNLESLTLIYCTLSQNECNRFIHIPEGLSPKLKAFLQYATVNKSEKSNPREQLRYLVLCSNLEQLLWPVPREKSEWDFPKTEFLHAISERTWPNLRELTMPALHFNDQELVQILDGLHKGHQDLLDAPFSPFPPSSRPWTVTGLKKLTLGASGFGSGALQSLATHFPTLTLLSLAGGMEKTSLVMQMALESCPGLVCIDGDLLYVSDMVQGKPWICGSSLQKLCIDIILDLEDDVFQKRAKIMEVPLNFTVPETVQLFVYGQLARLTQLKELNLCAVHPTNEDSPRRLSLDLEHGLGELATLTQLKQLEFRHVQKMTTREVEWMGVHWRKLKKITGEMNEDLEKQNAMQSILHRLKITLYRSYN